MATLEEILKLDSTSQVSDPKKSKAVAHLDEESRNMLHGIDCAGDRPHKKGQQSLREYQPLFAEAAASICCNLLKSGGLTR